MSESLPSDFPGYAVEGLVGRGGMGRVFRAVQIATRRPVAIKLLTTGKIDPGRLAAFRREAATLAQLEHPHIVPLYDYGEHNGVPYLVVRYLGGGTVADRLGSGPVAIGEALRWIGDTADALDAAHRRGITHRDVKPSNLLLDESGNVYLGDFGIAATGADLATAPHSGSAAYASPEQARGEMPGPPSDVYSLAVTAFEVLTGRLPYESETPLGMMVRHMHDPVPSAQALNPTLSPSVDAAIARGMAKAPSERPPSAGDFARSLAAAASGGTIPTIAAPGAGTARRRRTPLFIVLGLVIAAACLVGLVTVGGGLGAWLASSSTRAAPTTTRAAPPTPAPPTASPVALTLPHVDDFSDPSSGFGTTPPNDPDGEVAYADGTLRITVWTPGVELLSPLEGMKEQDLQVVVEATLGEGPAGREAGVACRWQDQQNYIAAAARADGMVSLWKMTDGVMDRWQDWTPALSPSEGPTHPWSLQLTCRGSDVRFSIDGDEVAVASDAAPATGSLALLAGLLEPGRTVASFDGLEVTRP
ncbi:MAG TPA: serine/threonine-protein kinase [Anaerolineales bacterium]|nr:serine/threonine-protein kinase [Anaerolineales bacterium]